MNHQKSQNKSKNFYLLSLILFLILIKVTFVLSEQNASSDNFECYNNLDCNDINVLTIDECVNPGTNESYCLNTPINCVIDNDCGVSGSIDNEFCSEGDIYKNYKSSVCVNPGTNQSYCNVTITPIFRVDCGENICDDEGDKFCKDGDVYQSQSCFERSCGDGICLGYPSINDNLIEECNNGCLDGVCIDEPNECTLDSNCPADYYGNNYCENEVILHDFHNFSCLNGNCNENVTTQFVDGCQYGCLNGQCIQPNIECNQNSDCGITGFIDNNFCSLEDIYKNFKNSTCINPETPQSYCDVSITPLIISDCGEDSCTDFDDNYCKDGNVYHSRTCFDRGCSINMCYNDHQNDEVLVQSCEFGCTDGQCDVGQCNMDSQCSDDYSSSNYCKNDKVVKDFHDFSCDIYQCKEVVTTQDVENCQYGCMNGACLEEPNQCALDSECEDDHYTDNYCKDDDVYREFHNVSCEDSSCVEDKTEELVEECENGCYYGECNEEDDNEENNDRETPHDERYEDCLIDDDECIEYFKSLEKFDNKKNADKEEQYSYQSTQVYAESRDEGIVLGKISLTKTTEKGKSLMLSWLTWLIIILMIILLIIIVAAVFRLMI